MRGGGGSGGATNVDMSFDGMGMGADEAKFCPGVERPELAVDG